MVGFEGNIVTVKVFFFKKWGKLPATRPCVFGVVGKLAAKSITGARMSNQRIGCITMVPSKSKMVTAKRDALAGLLLVAGGLRT